jgi:hypothetical protein
LLWFESPSEVTQLKDLKRECQSARASGGLGIRQQENILLVIFCKILTAKNFRMPGIVYFGKKKILSQFQTDFLVEQFQVFWQLCLPGTAGWSVQVNRHPCNY